MMLCLRGNVRSSKRSILNLTNLVTKNEEWVYRLSERKGQDTNQMLFHLASLIAGMSSNMKREVKLGTKAILWKLIQYMSKFPSFSWFWSRTLFCIQKCNKIF